MREEGQGGRKEGGDEEWGRREGTRGRGAREEGGRRGWRGGSEKERVKVQLLKCEGK